MRRKARLRFAILISDEKRSIGRGDVGIRKRALLKVKVAHRD